MSLSSTDKGLLTPGNCAVISIDHQPQMLFGVANIDRQDFTQQHAGAGEGGQTFSRSGN
jgi:hypothetical protein